MRTVFAVLASLMLTTPAAAQSVAPEFHSISRFVVSDPGLPEQALVRGLRQSGQIDRYAVKRFAIDLNAGEFAAIRLDQIGGDLVLTLFDPAGRLIAIVDQNSLHETEVGTIIARQGGRYVAQVAQFDWQAGAADFAIEVAKREPLARTPQARADQLMESWYDADHPGAAVAVVVDHRVVYRRTIGLADVERRVPIGPHTRFELASVSKQFTGYAIAMLIASGQLSRDDDVRKYLPELPEFGTPITIGQLLDHTSGLRDWDAGLAIAGSSPEHGASYADVLAFVARQRSLNFTPGSAQVYSNTGYVLLGEIVGRVTGTAPEQWLQHTLFGPLGMTDTMLLRDPQQVVAGRANSYEGRTPVVRIASATPSAIGGSTSIVSSVDDLIRWTANLEDPQIGAPSLQSLMASPAPLPDGSAGRYAFGLWHQPHRGLPSIGHLGLWAGFRTRVTRFPDQRAAIIFLANDGDDATYARSEQLEELFLPVEPNPPPETPTDSPGEPSAAAPMPELAAFEGLFYSSEFATAYRIEAKAGSLVATHPVNGTIALRYAGNDSFATGRWYMPILSFRRDSSGRIAGFSTSTEGSRDMVFRRIAEP